MRLIVVGITDLLALERRVYRAAASLFVYLKDDKKIARLEIFFERRSGNAFSVGVTRLGADGQMVAQDETIETMVPLLEGVNLETTISFFAYRFGQLMLAAGWVLREQVSPANTEGFLLDRVA